MKRTYEQSLTFFKRDTSKRGEGRELYKTPYIIIERIVENLLSEYPELKDRQWVDPCAGDGRWSNIIKSFNIDCISYDVVPLSTNVIKQDFLTSNFNENNLFFIGNPPFSLLKQFIRKALSFTDLCYFLGGSQIITGTLSNKVKLLHRFEGAEGNQKDKRSKINFIDSNNNNVLIWSCGALFDNCIHNEFIRDSHLQEDYFRVSVGKYVRYDNRVICLNAKR